MAIYTGTKSASGDSAAIIDPGATKKVHLRGDQQLQSEATGALTILLKVGTTTVRRVYCANAGDGVLFEIDYVGAAGETVIVNLSAAVAMGYVLNATLEGA